MRGKGVASSPTPILPSPRQASEGGTQQSGTQPCAPSLCPGPVIPTGRTKSRSSWSRLLFAYACVWARASARSCACTNIHSVGGGQGRDSVGGFFRVQVRAALHVLLSDSSTGELGKARATWVGKPLGWAQESSRRPIDVAKVRTRAAGVAGAEVRSSSACVSESRVPSSPKCAPQGWREGAGKRSGCRAAPRPGPRHTPRGIGEEEGPLAGGQLHSHTHPHPPIHTRLLSPPTAPPLRPRQPRGSTSPECSPHRPFQQNNTTHRPQHPHRAGSGATPSPPPAAPRAPPRAPSRAPAAAVAESRPRAAGERDGA